MVAWQREVEDLLRRTARAGAVTRAHIQDQRADHPDFVDIVHGAPDSVYMVMVQVFPLSQQS